MLGGALREVFAIFGVQVDPEGNIAKGHQQVSGLKAAFEGAVAVFAGSALLNATRAVSQELGVIADVRDVTGLATDTIQALGFQAEQSGGSVEGMNASLLVLQRSLAKTDKATTPQADAVKALGIAMEDASGAPRGLNEVLPEIFGNFHKLKDAGEEATVAQTLFGKAGLKMLPALRQGTAGLELYRAQLDELGGPVPEETIDKANAMNNAFVKLDRSFFNLKASIGAEVFPRLEKLVVGISKGVGRVQEFAKTTTLATSSALALGAAVAGPLMTALGPLLKPGLKFAAIFLAMDDLVAFLQGKDSVIGAILNGFFGPETTAGVRDWTNGVVADFVEVWNSGVSIFAALNNGWSSMLLDMSIAIDTWILGVYSKWNELVKKLGLGSVLNVDATVDYITTGLNRDKATRDAVEIDAYERSTGTGKYEPPAAKAAREANTGVVFNRQGNKDLSPEQQALAGMFERARFGGGPNSGPYALPELPPPHELWGRGATVPAPPVGFTAPLPAAPAPQRVENHIDARTTVTATTNADPKAIADAIAEKQKDSLRNAYTSVTSRGASEAFR